jgi:hypothetical protein
MTAKRVTITGESVHVLDRGHAKRQAAARLSGTPGSKAQDRPGARRGMDGCTQLMLYHWTTGTW